MKYKKYELGNYNIHIVKTDPTKFKTVLVQIDFRRELKKEELTVRNLLPGLLIKTTNDYKTNRELCIALEDLYEMRVTSEPINSGNYSVIHFSSTFLNESFTEPKMLEKSLTLLLDMLMNPNVKDKSFEKESFEICKSTLKSELEQAKDNARLYSTNRMLEEMAEGESFGFNVDGYLEDLEKLTPENVYQYYLEVLEKDLIDIYVIGDVEGDKVKDIISKKLKIKTFKKPANSHFIEHKFFRKDIKTVIEKKAYEQSNLAVGFKISEITPFERQYVLPIYNFIFGGGPDSKLFQTIREKNSLCYTVGSNIKPVTNILVVKAGIDKKNYDKTLKLIKELFKKMNNGDFKEDDVLIAINSYKVSLKEMLDEQNSIISCYASHEYLGYDLIPDRMKNIDSVTKKDLITLGKKIKLDTVYLLEGDINENN